MNPLLGTVTQPVTEELASLGARENEITPDIWARRRPRTSFGVRPSHAMVGKVVARNRSLAEEQERRVRRDHELTEIWPAGNRTTATLLPTRGVQRDQGSLTA